MQDVRKQLLPDENKASMTFLFESVSCKVVRTLEEVKICSLQVMAPGLHNVRWFPDSVQVCVGDQEAESRGGNVQGVVSEGAPERKEKRGTCQNRLGQVCWQTCTTKSKSPPFALSFLLV